jgi:hypothetical protein
MRGLPGERAIERADRRCRRPGHPSHRRRGRVAGRQPIVVGQPDRRLPRRARCLSRRRTLRLVSGRALGVRGRTARPRARPTGARGGLRRGAVLALVAGGRSRSHRDRPVGGHVAARAIPRGGDRSRRTARAGRRHPPAVCRRELRPGLLGLRRRAVRRRLSRCHGRGGAGVATGRAVGFLGDPSGAVELPG